MFDPRIGRFLQEDPIGFDGGDENLYRYVGNNVTNATDPSGLQRMQDDDARYQEYLNRNSRRPPSELLNFDQWREREYGRTDLFSLPPPPPPPPPSHLGSNPLGPTPDQAERDRREREFALGQHLPFSPSLGYVSPLEQQLLDERLRRLQFELQYYDFWFNDLPGALSGIVTGGASGGRSRAMPRRVPRRVQMAAQQRFEADLGRIARICDAMRARGDAPESIARWRFDARARADGRLFRALDQLPDTLPPLPAPAGIQD